MPGKQAKVLSDDNINDLLVYASCTRQPVRNRVLVLLSAKAGLRAGDVLFEFDSKPIQNLYDFTYALRSKKPGDEVLVKVLRGNETISATVLLTKRVE